jgi:hypothetical protein
MSKKPTTHELDESKRERAMKENATTLARNACETETTCKNTQRGRFGSTRLCERVNDNKNEQFQPFRPESSWKDDLNPTDRPISHIFVNSRRYP